MESCVYVKHIPTGIEVKCDETRSQAKNKELALKILVNRLDNIKIQTYLDRINKLREEAMTKGTIRTYDFKSGIVKNHLTGTKSNLKDVLQKGKINLIQ